MKNRLTAGRTAAAVRDRGPDKPRARPEFAGQLLPRRILLAPSNARAIELDQLGGADRLNGRLNHVLGGAPRANLTQADLNRAHTAWKQVNRRRGRARQTAKFSTLIPGRRPPRDHGVGFPDGAAFVAGSFQGFVGDFRPEFFERPRCRLVRVPFGIIRCPWH